MKKIIKYLNEYSKKYNRLITDSLIVCAILETGLFLKEVYEYFKPNEGEINVREEDEDDE